MIKFVILFTAILFANSCKNPNSTSSKSSDELKADSLRLVADSLAIMRNMHAMQTGVHIHNNGDLAAVAHQDPKKTERIKKVQRESRAERIAKEKLQSEAMQKALEKN